MLTTCTTKHDDDDDDDGDGDDGDDNDDDLHKIGYIPISYKGSCLRLETSDAYIRKSMMLLYGSHMMNGIFVVCKLDQDSNPIGHQPSLSCIRTM